MVKIVLVGVVSLSMLVGGLSLASFPKRFVEEKSCSCPNCDCQQVDLDNEVVSPYVEFMDRHDDCIGAGTILVFEGKVYVLTAGHVVDAIAPDTKVHLRKIAEAGQQYRVWIGTVVAKHFDESVDLGLVEVLNPEGLTPAHFRGDVKLHRGQEAWYIGTPGRLHAWLEKSIIARPEFWADYSQWNSDHEAYRVGVNGNGWYGNSGGGLYVEDSGHFYLVGVIVELARPGEKAPCLAIPQSLIQEFLSHKSEWKVQ